MSRQEHKTISECSSSDDDAMANHAMANLPSFRELKHKHAHRHSPPSPSVSMPQVSPPTVQSTSLSDDTTEDRREEEEELMDQEVVPARKRQKTLLHKTVHSTGKRSGRSDNWMSMFLDRLHSDPNVAQIVATSGGLVTYWNPAFSRMTRSSASLDNFPLTIFDLVESKSLSSLYAMLALALHNTSIVEEDPTNQSAPFLPPSSSISVEDHAMNRRSSGSSHLSVSLPCKLTSGSSTQYNITIIFMHDLRSKCFVGFLTLKLPSSPCNISANTCTPNHVSSSDVHKVKQEEANLAFANTCQGAEAALTCGKILHLDDNILCKLIFDTK